MSNSEQSQSEAPGGCHVCSGRPRECGGTVPNCPYTASNGDSKAFDKNAALADEIDRHPVTLRLPHKCKPNSLEIETDGRALSYDENRAIIDALRASRSAEPGPVTDALVDRFLSWPLPESVCADLCASQKYYPHRIGTNLLTADEARQMLEHVLAAPSSELRSGETPRTDAEAELRGGSLLVRADFSRQLERELYDNWRHMNVVLDESDRRDFVGEAAEHVKNNPDDQSLHGRRCRVLLALDQAARSHGLTLDDSDRFVLREIAECEALAEGQKEFLRRLAASSAKGAPE